MGARMKGVLVVVDVFYWMLNMSILGTLLGGLVLLIRKVKIIPRLFIYLLWGLVFIRLVCPIGMISGFSFLNLLPEGIARVIPMTSSVGVEEAKLSLTNFIQNAKEYQPVVIKSDGLQELYQIALMVWLMVAVCLIVGNVMLYWFTERELKHAVLIKERIYESNKISMPMVLGIIKPIILLPSGVFYDDKNVSYILAHEYIHLHRHDNLWRILSILVACLHWFNPMVWFMLTRYFEDMELACDEGALRKMRGEERSLYAEALLNYAKKGFRLHTSSFGGSRVRTRIERVISYRNITLISTLGFSLLFFFLVILLLSNS